MSKSVKAEVKSLRDDELLKFFIGSMNKLRALLIKENKLLNAVKIPELYEIVDEKKYLVESVYEVENYITSDPHVISNATQRIKTEAREIYAKLVDLMVETKINLEVNLRVGGSMINYIQNEVTGRRKQELGYDKKGLLSSHDKIAKSMPHLSVSSRI